MNVEDNRRPHPGQKTPPNPMRVSASPDPRSGSTLARKLPREGGSPVPPVTRPPIALAPSLWGESEPERLSVGARPEATGRGVFQQRSRGSGSALAQELRGEGCSRSAHESLGRGSPRSYRARGVPGPLPRIPVGARPEATGRGGFGGPTGYRTASRSRPRPPASGGERERRGSPTSRLSPSTLARNLRGEGRSRASPEPASGPGPAGTSPRP